MSRAHCLTRFRRKATSYRDAMRLTVRGSRTGAHLEMWADGVRASTLPVRDLQDQWLAITHPDQS